MSTPNFTNWNGNALESAELAAAVERNCACEADSDGHRTKTCAPHRMLTDDQRALNGLLFVRHIADRLRRQELAGLDLVGYS